MSTIPSSNELELIKRNILRDILCRYYFNKKWDTEWVSHAKFINTNWNTIVWIEAMKSTLISEKAFLKKYILKLKLVQPPEGICNV